jgi:hypothetical protein
MSPLGFDAVTAVVMKITVFLGCNTAYESSIVSEEHSPLSSWWKSKPRTNSARKQVESRALVACSSTLKMKAICCFEMSVDSTDYTALYPFIPEDSTLHVASRKEPA